MWINDATMRIYAERMKIDLGVQHFDFNDAPVFESQASFLRRHELLAPGELKRFSPTDFAPETLPQEYWP
jgi:hypothetical protein